MKFKPAYLDRDSVAQFAGLGLTTMQAMVQKGAFPQPRQISDRRVAWLVREVEEWAESRPIASGLPVANCGRNQ